MAGTEVPAKDARLQYRIQVCSTNFNEELFNASYHGKLRCRNCHEGVDEIPHKNAKKVNCARDCHLNDPSSGKKFSHKKIVDDLSNSVHGAEGTKSEYKKDLPKCKYCHKNKPYQASVVAETGALEELKVCHECHRSESWANRFYRHMLYRVSTRRQAKDIVELCSSCHADPKMMGRHGLDVVVSFEDTFHGQAIKFGSESVANCLKCHAPRELGFSPHRMVSRKDKRSPVHPDNKINVCRNPACHPGADQAFAAGGKVHPSGAKGIMVKMSLGEMEGVDLESEEVFQAKVIMWIRLFYKILIALVVGGLALHRIPDLIAVRREIRKGGH